MRAAVNVVGGFAELPAITIARLVSKGDAQKEDTCHESAEKTK
jgi:hypothetical protein